MMKKYPLLLASVIITNLTACQTLPKTAQNTAPIAESTPIAFNISGKIGITTQTADGKTGVSAFYGWTQEGERFAINLTGALGVGVTQIHYDGKTAILTTDQTTLTADSPNELLFKATGWHAPIDKLPHWVMGKPAQGDKDTVWTDSKLSQSKNGDWTAIFTHQNALPSRITMTHADGHRVVLTINHQSTKTP